MGKKKRELRRKWESTEKEIVKKEETNLIPVN